VESAVIFAWLRRKSAEATLRDQCGFVDVERFDGGVRSLALSPRDARVVEWRDTAPHWRMSIQGVNAPALLLYPSANEVSNDVVRKAVEGVVRFREPYPSPEVFEIDVADGALRVSWNGFHAGDDGAERWKEYEARVLALALGADATACPSCRTPLRDRGGLASCDACKGRLIASDVARERIFDPRGIDPGVLKDASVGRGLVARCPSCAHPMAPVLVDDTVVDVCRGCGALWCDAGEHARLMGGMT
jgi:hypothetical protein